MENRREVQNYWAWRRLAAESGEFLNWLRWQLETKWRKKQLSRNFLAQRIEDFLNSRGGLCTNVCKGMYFCELKSDHRGKHQCANGGLKWTSKEGFFP